jgi:phospho-N-acetylmuramoyl-pentapeptide-transferase
MLFLLIRHFQTWLDETGLGFLRVFTFAQFQALIAVVVSFGFVLVLGPRTIATLRRLKVSDRPEFDQPDINEAMKNKKDVPTMGGILIIASIFLTCLLLADLSNFYVKMALLALVWLGGVGAVDDYLKLTRKPGSPSRDGLTSLEKLLFQIGLAVVLCYFTWYYGQNLPDSNKLYLPFFKQVAIPIPLYLFIALGVFVVVGASNAVNLTDGLDGLAAGCMSFASFAFLVLALIVGVERVATFLFFPYIQAADQMAVICGAMLGSCMGFLWYNCHPARVFMGDTGSLALGGLLGYVAIVTRQEAMLALVGGIFVLEALSVIIQKGWFKYTKRKYGAGRRVFLMAPIHHHFQKLGWAETQIVTRFWLVSALLAAVALATIKLR